MLKSVVFIFIIILLSLEGCAVSTTFTGPKSQRLEKNQEVIVVVTHAILKETSEKKSTFWSYVTQIENSLNEHDGFIGFSKRRTLLGDEAWTLTVWKDVASLNKFVRSKIHQRAIQEAMPSLNSMRFTRFTTSAKKLPVPWEQALKVLEEQNIREER